MSRLAKMVALMALTTPLIVLTLGGCIWHSKETKEVEAEKRQEMNRLTKTVTTMALTTPLLVATLGGCVWHSKVTKEVARETGAPVVMAPPPSSGPVVMSPGPTPTAPAPTVTGQTDRVVYQEGRWQLYGDGRNSQYYWV